MNISDSLKKFLNYTKQDINNNDWNKVFNLTNILNVRDYYNFLNLIKMASIDPLPYIKYIPEAYFKDSDIKKYKVPNNIKNIYHNAFCRSKIEKIYFPTSLIYIATNAFKDCNNLKEIIYEGTVEELDKRLEINNLNNDVIFNIGIKCKDGIMEYYKKNDSWFKKVTR